MTATVQTIAEASHKFCCLDKGLSWSKFLLSKQYLGYVKTSVV